MAWNLLNQQVIQWAEERGIFEKSNPRKQMDKTLEEIQELSDAIDANDRAGIIDGIGDVVVTLILQAHMQGLTVEECLTAAYEEIKDRRGSMVGGLFVKESV
jgi:NTP pyrophosphatase (non-canonical NTP hydrolase)